jgi:hypothetical protein
MKTNKEGSTMSVAFNGTGITIFGARKANHGHYLVKLDNTEATDIDGYSTTEAFRVPLFEEHDLPQGFHTVSLTNLNETRFLDIDYVGTQSHFITRPDDILPCQVTIETDLDEQPDKPLRVVTFQDTDNSFTWLPSPSQWDTNPSDLGSYLGGTGQSVIFILDPIFQCLIDCSSVTQKSDCSVIFSFAVSYHSSHVRPCLTLLLG